MNRTIVERTARPIVAGLLILLALVAVLGSAIREPRPHDIPVGVTGPQAVIASITAGFAQAAPGAFSFTTYASDTDARAALERRDVVASLIVGQAGPRLVVAGAAGDAVTGAVTAAFTSAFNAQGTELAVETVHPFPAGDPHGIVLFFLVLATLIASVAVGALSVLPAPGRPWSGQVATVAAYALCAGILGVGAAAWLANGLGDGVWMAMGIVGLLALAIGSATVALARVLGVAGVALGAFVVILLDIVSSGGPLGSTFLPDAYRALAPWLPVGPAYDALRGALAYGGQGLAGSAVVLLAWAAAGIGIAAVHGSLRPAVHRAVPAAA
jgi:hypothetical protein